MDLNTVAGFDLITGGIISGLIVWGGHYFPWHKLLGEELSRLWAYRYGSAACWIGFSYWRYFGLSDWISPIGLMIVYAIAGTVVGWSYKLDRKGHKKTVDNRVAKGNGPSDAS